MNAEERAIVKARMMEYPAGVNPSAWGYGPLGVMEAWGEEEEERVVEAWLGWEHERGTFNAIPGQWGNDWNLPKPKRWWPKT